MKLYDAGMKKYWIAIFSVCYPKSIASKDNNQF